MNSFHNGFTSERGKPTKEQKQVSGNNEQLGPTPARQALELVLTPTGISGGIAG